MAHLYHAEEWEANGKWYVNDTQELDGAAGLWWTPARIMGVPLQQYVSALAHIFFAVDLKLIDTPDGKTYLNFAFETQADARKYKNYINKIAREKNAIV